MYTFRHWRFDFTLLCARASIYELQTKKPTNKILQSTNFSWQFRINVSLSSIFTFYTLKSIFVCNSLLILCVRNNYVFIFFFLIFFCHFFFISLFWQMPLFMWRCSNIWCWRLKLKRWSVTYNLRFFFIFRGQCTFSTFWMFRTLNKDIQHLNAILD